MAVDGSNEEVACPLHSRSRNGNAPAEQVEWAGLPINLDLAFSQNQRDKVLAQHRMLRRGALLRRWSLDDSQACVCEDAAKSVSSR